MAHNSNCELKGGRERRNALVFRHLRIASWCLVTAVASSRSRFTRQQAACSGLALECSGTPNARHLLLE